MGLSDCGFAKSGGQLGLPSHGSVRTRLPEGKPMMNVEWPSQVMEGGAGIGRIILRGFMSGPVPVQFIRGRRVKDVATARAPKPEWLKVRAPGSPEYLRLKGLMRDLKLNTVCEEAHCPNIGECWHHGRSEERRVGKEGRSRGT